jgi:hypothetical protein
VIIAGLTFTPDPKFIHQTFLLAAIHLAAHI